MRVRLKGINSKRKRLADSSLKTYYYAWKGGPPLRGDPGSPEFVASYNAAVAQKITPPTGAISWQKHRCDKPTMPTAPWREFYRGRTVGD
jgi:hypothetical protein